MDVKIHHIAGEEPMYDSNAYYQKDTKAENPVLKHPSINSQESKGDYNVCAQSSHKKLTTPHCYCESPSLALD